MIIPTLLVQVHKQAGFDLRGQPKMTAAAPVLVAPVKVKFTNQHTTVRTDSAGSHGHAEETAADVVLLVKLEARVAPGDMLVISGHKVRVASKHPRYSIAGKLDHYQLDCVAWV